MTIMVIAMVIFPACQSTAPPHGSWTGGAGKGEDLRHHQGGLGDHDDGLDYHGGDGGVVGKEDADGDIKKKISLVYEPKVCRCKSMQPLYVAIGCSGPPRSRPNLERKFHHKVLVGAGSGQGFSQNCMYRGRGVGSSGGRGGWLVI